MLIVDSKILQDFSEHLIQVHNYPPFVSKVCAYMHFDFYEKGVTFEEIHNYFGVSKSSVSFALKFLENLNHISFVMRDDCRKRYFKLNQDYVIDKYRQIFDSLSNEKKLLQDIQQFKSRIGIEENALDAKINTVVDIIERNTANLHKAIQSLTQINNNNNPDEENN